MLTEYIEAGMDGIRVFCDDGYDTCKRLIATARLAAKDTSRRIVISIELMRKISIDDDWYRIEEDVCWANQGWQRVAA